jgi:hypothetical protein
VQALLQVGRQATNTARQMVLVYKYTRLRRWRHKSLEEREKSERRVKKEWKREK